LSSAFCKVPVACCHQRFAKCLLSSTFCKVPVVISILQRKSRVKQNCESWGYLGSDCESPSWRCRQRFPLKHWCLSTEVLNIVTFWPVTTDSTWMSTGRFFIFFLLLLDVMLTL
jgi:hypothetical protein